MLDKLIDFSADGIAMFFYLLIRMFQVSLCIVLSPLILLGWAADAAGIRPPVSRRESRESEDRDW